MSQDTVDQRTAPPRLHFSVPPEPSHLLRARERIRDYLEQNCSEGQVSDDLVLCIEEAATNAIRHSGSEEHFEISLRFEDGNLHAEVRDHGRGFDTSAFDPEAVPDVLVDHGRGLFLISRLCDELALHSEGGLAVRMVKRAVASCGATVLESGLPNLQRPVDPEYRDVRLRALLEEIDEAFVALDWEYRYVHANEAASRWMGKSRAELLGRRPWDLWPASADSAATKAYRAAMELGRSSTIEEHSVVSDDWREVRVYPTTVGISVYVREINERKRKEEAHDRLLARTTLLNRIAAAAAETLDFKELAEQALEAVRELLGATTGNIFLIEEEASVLRSLAHFGVPEEALHLYGDIPLDSSTINGRVALNGEIATHDAPDLSDATTRVQQVTGAAQSGWIILPVRARGATLATLGFSFQSRRAFEPSEVALYQSVADQLGVGLEKARLFDEQRESEERFRALVSASSDVVYRMSPDWTEMRQLQGSEFVPDTDDPSSSWLEKYIHPDDQPRVLAAIAEAIRTKSTFALEHRVLTVDGSLGWTSSRAIPLLGADGEIVEWLGATSDISARKRAEEERQRLLEESQAQAEELQTQSEELQSQGEELRAQYEEQLVQRDAIVRESELRASLNTIAELLHSTLESDEVMRRVLAEATRALAIDAAAIELNEGGTWPLRYAEGLPAEALGVPLAGEPVCARLVAYSGEALVLDDAGGHETVGPFAARYAIRSLIAVPLLARDQTLGVLFLFERLVARHFGPAEVDFARRFATMVGMALENARLYEAEVEAKRQTALELETTSVLLEVATAVTSWADLDQMLQSLGDLVVRSTDHSRVVLELWDEERQEIEVAVSKGSAAVPRQRFGFDEISEAARQVITTRKTLVIDYAEIGLPGALKNYLGEHAFLLLLAVPIVYRGRLVGLIMVDQPGERRPFTPREIDLVEAVAGQAGAAIETTRLLQRETETPHVEKSPSWSAATRLVRRLRGHPWRVLIATIALQSAILWGLGTVGTTRRVLGVPGSMVALAAVVAGAVAGPLVGTLVALAGGVVFFATVADYGSRSSGATTAISTAIWVTAGLVSGFLAKGLREQTERRRLSAVALARADAAREAQLAEQARIEELASGLQTQSDALAERADFAEALNTINGVVHSTIDTQDIMQRALAQGVAALGADSGTIELWQGESWVVAYQHGFSDEVVGLHLRAEQAPIASQARATTQPVAVADMALEPRLDIGFPQAHGLQSAYAVPLMVRQEVIGCLLIYGRRPRSFTETEADFARQLGATVSLALDNARLYLDQRRIAQTLQENFIHELPVVPGLELGVVAQTSYEPELVGGDFSDVFVVDDTHVVALIGDVAGKGVQAAGMTETVRSTVRALAAVDPSPAFILAKANELLLKFDLDEPHVTVFLAVLNPHTGHLNYASAGHPSPVHLGAYSGRPLGVTFGPPLGSFARPYENAHTMLTLDDYLVLYTDGVTEARHEGELLGEQRLLEVCASLRGRSAQEVAEGVRDAALAHAGRLRDDLQVVVLRLA